MKIDRTTLSAHNPLKSTSRPKQKKWGLDESVTTANIDSLFKGINKIKVKIWNNEIIKKITLEKS